MKTYTSANMKIPNSASQRGVGMVEVLVAMVLLAIGVLGYAALQVRAVEATGDALNRSQAMVILRGLAEEIRVNSTAQGSYTGTGATSPTANCFTGTCSPAELATFDAYQTAQAASRLGMSINMVGCPGGSGTITRKCLIAAWGNTTATIGSAATDCMSSTTTAATSTTPASTAATYNASATCVIMEAY